MSMDLRLLRYFVAIVDAGSATRAARALHVTQPVLSRQLHQLERSLGLRLFEPEGRGLRLTGAGEVFLAEARGLLSHADQVERAAGVLASGRLAVLHLAAPTTTLTDVLAPFLSTLGPDDPIPQVLELDPRDALAALRAGADMAIATHAPSQAVAWRLIAALPILAYVRDDDPWARRKSVLVTELAARRLVLLPAHSRPRALLDAAMDAAAVGYGEIIEVANAQVAQAIAAAGRGVAVVSDDPRFDLVPLTIDSPGGPVMIRLYAAWDPRHPAAGTIARLAERLTAFCVVRYGPGVSPAR